MFVTNYLQSCDGSWRWCRIFDEDDDGCIHAGDLVDVLTTFGEKLTKSEAKKLVQSADKKEGGLIDYEGSRGEKYNDSKVHSE